MLEAPSRICPVCGDPRPYTYWRGPMDPPCPYGAYQVVDCSHQMFEVKKTLLWQQVAPDCFDANGRVLPNRLAEVIERVTATGIEALTLEPRRTPEQFVAEMLSAGRADA